MELKDVSKRSGTEGAERPVPTKGREASARAIAKLSVPIPERGVTERKGREPAPVSVDTGKAQERGTSRESLNRVIDAVNSVQETAKTLDTLVGSIAGIVKQVEGGNLPKGRVAKLEEEANGLVAAIKEVEIKPAEGVKSVAVGDKVKVEIAALDKALDIIFPDSTKSGFGLGTIRFEPKEQILKVRESVLAAKEQVEALRQSVDDAQQRLRGAIDNDEVAAENSQAAESSLRDLDQALKLASTARNRITSNPDTALGSAGVSQKAIELLRR
jgi:hypothetical protein